jgi:predicted lipoprotein with Yx(FWY)xxD motif
MSRVERAVLRSARWTLPVAAVAVSALGASAVLAASRSALVTTHQTKRGKVLAEANGHSLYMFSSDKPGRSNCNGSCTNTWLPDLTSGRPAAAPGTGVNAKLLGTIKRSDHALQVTYNGHPLYAFNRDKSAGQINGEGANQFGGHWYVVNTSGNAVKPQPSNGGGSVCHPTCQGY